MLTRQTTTEEGTVFRFPVTDEAKKRLAVQDDHRERTRNIEAALQRDGYILLAWVLWGHRPSDTITAVYLPEDGKRWVYRRNFDAQTMREIGDSYSRTPCPDEYQWFTRGCVEGLYKERHICAPLYLLLDNKELRAEYLAGRLEAIS